VTSSPFLLYMMDDGDSHNDKGKGSGIFEKHLRSGKFKDAYQILKRNPMQPIGKEEARLLLNNIEELDPAAEDPGRTNQQTIDASVLIYRRLQRQKTLVGFDCIQNDYPDNSIEVSPKKLEEVTGLSVTALTPKQRTTYWRLAGVGLCLVELFLGENLGVNPLTTLIPATILLLGYDQLRFKGAYFETLYRTLFPDYSKKVIHHEAGHFLVAYLLGIPVRGCVTNAWDANKYPELPGQAGTVFYDVKMAEEAGQQRVTRTSLDRLSVVTMAGIAAEALEFGVAEGGQADESSLIQLLSTSISPPWSILRIQGQARWAVLQAVSLIQEHKDAYLAVVAALEAGQGVGDVVLAIEANLPEALPALQRSASRAARKRRMESDALLRYVQKMTWNVDGILADPVDEQAPATSTGTGRSTGAAEVPALNTGASSETVEEVTTSTPDAQVEVISNVDVFSAAPATVAASPSASSRNVAKSTDDEQKKANQAVKEETGETIESPEENMAKIAQRLKFLERAVQSGDLNVEAVADSANNEDDPDPVAMREGKEGLGGLKMPRQPPGLWLNGLETLKRPESLSPLPRRTGDRRGIGSASSSDTTVSMEETPSGGSNDDLPSIPAPIEGYEEDMKKLAQAEGLIDEEGVETGVGIAYAAATEDAAALQELVAGDDLTGVRTDASVNKADIAETGERAGRQEGTSNTTTATASMDASGDPSSMSVLEMLRTNRGYQMKQMERIYVALQKKENRMSKRLEELEGEIAEMDEPAAKKTKTLQ